MINDEELSKLSRFFKIWASISAFTYPVAKYLSRHNVRFLSIAPSSMDTLMPDVNYRTKGELARALIIDSVIKRYQKHDEFVDLVIYAITNPNVNGVELELDNNDFTKPLMIARL